MIKHNVSNKAYTKMEGASTMKEIIIFILKLVGGHFWRFVKRIYVAIQFFVIPYFIAYAVSMLIPAGLRYLGVHYGVEITICRILLTIAPAIPTAIYAICKKEDRHEEFNMDFCFIIWIATIVYAWNILK